MINPVLSAPVMLALPLLAILAQAPAAAPTLDFTEEAKVLFRVVACGNDAPLPEGLDAKIVEEHCKEVNRRYGQRLATGTVEHMRRLPRILARYAEYRVISARKPST